MPSFTSSSSPLLKHILALLAILAIGQALLQFTATWVMRTYGKNEMRWAHERQRAEALAGNPKGILIIGSSVLFGIDEARLQKKLPDWTVRRLVMVGTFYTDWEFSLRRLFREGVKPAFVVLPPVPFQIYGDNHRGDYLPLHWLHRQDIPEFARRRKLDLTSSSNLYFASYNSFFALRDDFRDAMMGTLIPGHKMLIAGRSDKRIYRDGELDRITGERLLALQSLLAQNGARLLILRYPAPNMDAAHEMLERVSAACNIPYIAPLDSMPASAFEDPFHLNPDGTQTFTNALAPALSAELDRLRQP